MVTGCEDYDDYIRLSACEEARREKKERDERYEPKELEDETCSKALLEASEPHLDV